MQYQDSWTDMQRRQAYPEAFAYSTQPKPMVVMTLADGRYQFAQLGRVGNAESRSTATTIIWRTDPNTRGCQMTEAQARRVLARLPTGTAAMVDASAAIEAFKKGRRT